MLRIPPGFKSAAQAKSYYRQSDYYGEGHQETVGRWGGKGAARLGLSGTVDQKSFDLLCDNLDPRSFDPATGKYKSLTERTRDDRIVGWDFNFNAPKGVTLALERAYATGNTEQAEAILQAFRDAMHDTMADIEAGWMATRVRKGGQDSDRLVGNMIYAEYIHRTARPPKVEEGEAPKPPDCALHAHCFVPNAVYDPVEKKFKAARMEDVIRNRPRFSEEFHARLSRRMYELGFDIEQRYTTDKKGRKKYEAWDVAGISRDLVEKFSQRQQEVKARADELGIDDPNVIGTLAAKTRGRKAPELSMEELRAHWFGERTTDMERAELDGVLAKARLQQGRVADTRDAEEMAYSILHHSQRAAALPERKLYVTALQHGMGQVTPEGLKREAIVQGVFTAMRNGERMVSTREILGLENKITSFARDTRGTCAPLGRAGQWLDEEELNAAQKKVVRQLLDSCDRVQVFKGKAGVGKSRSLRSVVKGIIDAVTKAAEKNGHHAVLVAPTAEASRENLRADSTEAGDSFDLADTLSRLLVDTRMQARLRNGVLIVDEAGLVGVRSMAAVVDVLKEYNARLIGVGDSAQHAAPEQGGALWLLEHRSGLTPAVLEDIQRQEDPRHKKAVVAFSDGRPQDGLDQIDALGWVHEIADDEERYRQLARDYVATMQSGLQALAISPTHVEGKLASDAIRAELRAQGRLKGDDGELLRWERLDLSVAERGDGRQYEPGRMVQFVQNARGGFKKGERVMVKGRDDLGHVCVETASGAVKVLPLGAAKGFEVFVPGTVTLAKGLSQADKQRMKALAAKGRKETLTPAEQSEVEGYARATNDRVLITQNWKTADGRHRLSRGKVYGIQGFTKDGNPILDNGWVVDKDAGVLSSGWAVTSHKSQGKTVKGWVFVAQSSASAGASSAEQAYVSASRSTKGVRWYTESKARLREAIARSERALTATELVEGATTRRGRLIEHVHHLRRWAGASRRMTGRVISRSRAAVARKIDREREWGRVVPPTEQERGLGYAR
jgi:conjugative relaxase-like TrwC/TraI family protein